MNRRLLWTLLLLSTVTSISLRGQTFRPLTGYDELQAVTRHQSGPALPKADCAPLDLTGITLLRPGGETERIVRPDTARLTVPITYNCLNCGEVRGGLVLPRGDTLVYTANGDVEEAADTLRVRACGSDGTCNDPTAVIILVQREGRTTDLPPRTVSPSETIVVSVPADEFARKASCRSIEACAPDYAGRERAFAFLAAQDEGNDFTYAAARYGGVDAVCVQLCTEFGLCDTYRTEIIVDRPARGLPFLDDFSADGYRPRRDLWQDEDVLVNRTLGQFPVSVGVATFDGVDANGASYPGGGGGRRTVIRDYLTSTPLEMAGQEGAALSFYVQPRGVGNRPEEQDSFLVEFLHPRFGWQRVMGLPGRPTTEGFDTIYPFEPYRLEVAGDYLYDGFTFRFAAKSSETGAVDMWHLDYVKLDRTSNTLATRDLALIGEPEPILGPYTSLPLRHFKEATDDLARPQLTVGMYNLNSEEGQLSSDKPSTISIFTGERRILISEPLTTAQTFGLALQAGAMRYELGTLNQGWGGLSKVTEHLESLPEQDGPIELITEYRLVPRSDNSALGPVTGANNVTESVTVLGEYMAYDDGSAEGTIEVPEQTTLLQRYTAYVDDVLRGVQVRIPRPLGSYGNQALRLVVYTGDSLPVDLVYEEDFTIVLPEDFSTDSLGGFTTYRFAGELPVEAGNFFVGFRQLRADRNIGIGFDRNIDSEGRQFFGFGGGWQPLQFGVVTGTLMFRPLLGGFEGPTTSTADEERDTAGAALVDVYPNPTVGEVVLRPRAGVRAGRLQVRLFSVSGAQVRQAAGTDRLDLTDLPAGLYLLEVRAGTRRSLHKVVRN